MITAEAIAEQAALQQVLNCYLRETGQGEWILAAKAPSEWCPGKAGVYLCELSNQGVQLLLGVDYYSRTGRHHFKHPVYYRTSLQQEPIAGDYVTIGALLFKELALSNGVPVPSGELLLRLIESCRCTAQYVACRMEGQLAEPGAGYIAAEQSLFTGHQFHPTPKSRQGMTDREAESYCPELGGQFQLHYFMAHPSLVEEESAESATASELVRELLLNQLQEADLVQHNTHTAYTPIPVHPLQAAWLLEQPEVKRHLASGKLHYAGEQGRHYTATSSLRTVYHPGSPYMLKFSVRVKLTNSLRVMRRKELASGVEISRLLTTRIGEDIRRFKGFQIIRDPAYLTLRLGGEATDSGFEVVLRDNPFRGGGEQDCALIAALVQDPLPGGDSHLAHIIYSIAEREGRPVAEVSIDWFRRYLQIGLRPFVWLYLKHGIALEAHQQNCVLHMSGGYPNKLYFRDNQGYYFCHSMKESLEQELPGIGTESGDVYEDAVTDEHLIYYLMVNHHFGLISGFGGSGLIDERLLLLELRRELAAFVPMDRQPSRFLQRLLSAEHLPCKANLLTRLHDMDELELPLEHQSVYVSIPNPLMNRSARRLSPERSSESALATAAGGGR
ncbi:IucA/IucC family protein [Paenibacillus daejeonensis]|uniref:IucA/IucC family protein n=1 Tax=Paenibacillus daejeonensis TaxID=135193 RepID=UPI00037D316F|nr:IucA/IucC family protein [Paenibacillus daejeonensis]